MHWNHPVTESLSECRSQTLEGHFSDPSADFQEVFVGGLPNDTTEQDVEQAFSAVGEVVCVRLNRRRKTGECKGFAFVRYKDLLTAERACRDVNKVSHQTSAQMSDACWASILRPGHLDVWNAASLCWPEGSGL